MKARSAYHAARETIRREMHSYDSMAQAPRYRVEKPKPRHNPHDIGLRSFHCAHGILLIEPCTKCRRTKDDAIRDYGVIFVTKVAELLTKVKA